MVRTHEKTKHLDRVYVSNTMFFLYEFLFRNHLYIDILAVAVRTYKFLSVRIAYVYDLLLS